MGQGLAVSRAILTIFFASVVWSCSPAAGAEVTHTEHGFSIVDPQGWHKHTPPGSFIFFYNRSPSPEERFPSIAVRVDQLNMGGPGALVEFAQRIVAQYQGGQFTVVEAVKEIHVGDIPGYRFVLQSPVAPNGLVMKMLHCIFQRDDQAIAIIYIARPDQWAQHLPDAEQLIQTLTLAKVAEVAVPGSGGTG